MASSPFTIPGGDRWGYALAIGGAILFSTKGIFIKLAYAENLPIETVLALRMLVALPIYGAILLAVLLRSPEARRSLTQPLPVLLIVMTGLLGYYLSSYLDFIGLAYVSAQYERLVLFTYPFFVLVLGVLFFKDRFSWTVVPGMVVSYCGIAALFGWNLVAEPDGLIEGTLFVLASALSFALYQHLAKRAMLLVSTVVFTCLAMSAAAIVSIGQDVALHGVDSLVHLSPRGLALGLALGLFATVLPSFMMNGAISRIGARGASSTGAVGPVFTALLAVMVLGEPFTAAHAVGTVLVILGTLAFSRAERNLRRSTNSSTRLSEPRKAL
jgi:drug/metabolite transporter (DMT)-like permease